MSLADLVGEKEAAVIEAGRALEAAARCVLTYHGEDRWERRVEEARAALIRACSALANCQSPDNSGL